MVKASARRGTRFFVRVCLSLVWLSAATIATPVPAAQAAVTSSFTVTGNAKVDGTAKPYRLLLLSNNYGYPTSLQLTLRRTVSGGNHPVQEHIFQFGSTTTDCADNLSTCTLDDQGEMGSYGRLHLSFTPSGPPVTTDVICGGQVVAHRTRRPGHLVGTLRLKTGTGYFHTVHAGGSGVHTAAVIAARAEKYTPTKTLCGPIDPPPCAPGISLAINASPYIRASTDPEHSRASLLVGSGDDVSDVNTFVLHEVSATVPISALRVTSDSPQPLQRAKANFDTLAPFANGTAKFRAAGDASSHGTCGVVGRAITMTGSISMHFDGYGTRTMTSGSGDINRTP